MNIEFQKAAQNKWGEVSPAIRLILQRGSFIKYIGNERVEGGTAPLEFYLFWCRRCDRPAKDYIHGFRGRESIVCSGCGARRPVRQWRAYILRILASIHFLFLSMRWRKP
jgi:translation initiation factor 2 beta subunit (eIF-2beta)/eIF-5